MTKSKPKISGPKISPPQVNTKLIEYFVGSKVSVSLKYLNTSCECFSDWIKQELKSFSKLIEKIRNYDNASQIQANTKLCHAHIGDPSQKRFRRPENISDDIKFYSLDVTDKARVHGFFIEGVFFLVWLDRKHECLKV